MVSTLAAYEIASNPPDKTKEAADAIGELIAEFGLRTFIAAVLHTEAGEKMVATNPAATQRVIQFILREIVFSNNPQLEAEVMAIGCGILNDNGVMTRVSAKHGITRQAVSKRVVAFCEEMKLPPSSAMKSVAARKRYALRNQPRMA